jgi:FKBP-type peptidyl-prolyl cis-trans isomerase FkpA
MIKPGGKMRIYVPPRLGYGSQDLKDASGNVVVPGNSILIFEVELVAVS